MNKPSSQIALRATTLALGLALCLSPAAVPASVAAAETAPGDGSIADLNFKPATATFQLAYDILSPGKHNYNGHRARAMTQIQAAAKLMGVEFERVFPKADETQGKSDARIVLAQRLLEQVRLRLGTEEAKPVLEHVDKALMQLDKALKIRAVEAE